ncbi:hypothetical protein VNO77_18346 [Canavalia gladiata]|uniref:Uncharacterized protein n=1 Tax=Canavalia gladiata TaxID=3824 RepID=A0AAN9QJJ6_CANGL
MVRGLLQARGKETKLKHVICGLEDRGRPCMVHANSGAGNRTKDLGISEQPLCHLGWALELNITFMKIDLFGFVMTVKELWGQLY